MKKKNNERRYFIVSLFIVVLSLAVGYALFAETLNITGTAQATGNFDVEFFSASLDAASSNLYGEVVNNPTIDGAKNVLTISQVNLKQPGAKAVFDVTVRNVGNIAAELLDVDFTGNTDPDITVTYAPAFVNGTTLAVGADYSFEIIVEWDIDSEDNTQKTINFTADLNYQQDN
jgi:hypothetical protein